MGNLIFSVAISAHLGMSGNFNSVHPTISYNQDPFVAGVFYNSESQPSMFVGQSYELKNLKVTAGIVTGYSGNSILPMLKINHNSFFVAPGYANGDVGVIAGYEWQF